MSLRKIDPVFELNPLLALRMLMKYWTRTITTYAVRYATTDQRKFQQDVFMPKPPAQLPQGNKGVLQGISENFSFHASPEAFIASRVRDTQNLQPDALDLRRPVRAKILNRNVAVISSYHQIKQVLESQEDEDGSPAYVASAAYSDLMNSFFPPPNLLLSDGKAHHQARSIWESRIESVPSSIASFARSIVQRHFERLTPGIEFDLYGSMKTLAWEFLLGAFLDLHPEDNEFTTHQRLHEDLLRGQFSVLPIRINLGLWHSPRKVGIDARTKLQVLIAERLRSSSWCCPFSMPDDGTRKDIADHILLFTSSLAVKALASLLTAFLLNLFIYRDSQNCSLAVSIRKTGDPETQKADLNQILIETERLSPPIVGVMRRCTRDNTLTSPKDQADVLLPSGWDVWLYFAGAGRDPNQFGEACDIFDPDRFKHQQCKESFAFGAGPKTCLGQGVIRDFALIVAHLCLEMKLNLTVRELPRGVRGWLGWESSVELEDWAADMKQLPTQRPARPVVVNMSRG